MILMSKLTLRKDHFAFGTNKRIWRLPEKLPPCHLYNYLHYEALPGHQERTCFDSFHSWKHQ